MFSAADAVARGPGDSVHVCDNQGLCVAKILFSLLSDSISFPVEILLVFKLQHITYRNDICGSHKHVSFNTA
jgi:hypothetical protein